MPTAWGYFDTSVVVKRYVPESGSSLAREVMRRHSFLSSAIAPLETLSAVSRRRRSGEVDQNTFNSILFRIELDRAHWELVPIDQDLLGRAEEIIRVANVRSLDAIHIATAVSFQERSGERIPFFSADERQLDAAARFGLRIQRIG